MKEKIPLFYGGLGDKSIISPKKKASNRASLKQLDLTDFPKNVILCFFRDFYKNIEKYNPEVYEYHKDFSIYVFNYGKKKIAFLYPTMGSYASMILEEMIALGGKNFICIGGAGTLTPDIERGQIILPTKAIRDEGVSYHYETPSFFSYPNESMVNKIRDVISSKGLSVREGATWTVSSFYGETESKLDSFVQEGAICTEMEAASFFSVSRTRGVELASLFIAGDSISNKKWESLKTTKNISNIKKDRTKLLQIALDSF